MAQVIRRAAIAAVCSGLLIACGSGSGAAKCQTGSDCRAGLSCVNSECLAPGECPSSATSCHVTTECSAMQECEGGCCAAILGCSSSTDCADPNRPHCDPVTSTCKACVDSSQCSGGTVCVATSGRCEAACNPANQGSDCSKALPRCEPNGGVTFCAVCASNGDCKNATQPTCSGGYCTGCSSDQDCGGATPSCDAPRHTCVPCLDASNANGKSAACADPAHPACQSETCVVCNPGSNDKTSSKNGACASRTPVCLKGASAAVNSCSGCDPASNDAVSGHNPACAGSALVCDSSTDSCVACTATAQCKTGDYCGSDKACHTPNLTFVCTGSTASACTQNATAYVGSAVSISVELDAAAVTDTVVPLALSTGKASFSASAVQSTGSVTVAAGTRISATPAIVTLDAADLGPVTVVATLGAASAMSVLTPSLVPADLASFTSNLSNVQEGQAATLTVTLDKAPTGTATVMLTNDTPALGTLLPTSVEISGGASAQSMFTAAALASGTATLHASYTGKTPRTLPQTLNVFIATVASLTSSAPSVLTGGTATLTVTLAQAAPGAAIVAISVDKLGALAGATPTTVVVAAGATSATFSFTGSTTAAGTATVIASAGGGSASAQIAVLPRITAVKTGNTVVAIGQAGTLEVDLDVSPAAPFRVYVNDYIKNFPTAHKQNFYMQSSIDVQPGQTSGTAPFAECESLPTAAPADLIQIGAWAPGQTEVELATPITVCPLGAVMGAAGAACPDTTAIKLAVCPISPLGLTQPANAPLMITPGLAYLKPLAATTQQLNLTVTPAGCGHFTQTPSGGGAPATITSINLNLSKTTTQPAASSIKTNLTFVPDAITLPATCMLTASLPAGTVGSPSSVTTTVNLVAPPGAPAPGDLVLSKVEYSESNKYPAIDTNEYIEIYNPGANSVALTDGNGTSLYGVSFIASPLTGAPGAQGFFDDRVIGKTEYQYVDLGKLAGITSIPGNGYLVIEDPAATAVTANLPSLQVAPVLAYQLPIPTPPATTPPSGEAIPNPPGAVFLVKSGHIIDGVSWGGMIVQATSPSIAGGAPFDWPQTGDPLDFWITDTPYVTGTLVRINTTGNNNLDWRFSTTVTPGAPNTVVTGP